MRNPLLIFVTCMNAIMMACLIASGNLLGAVVAGMAALICAISLVFSS